LLRFDPICSVMNIELLQFYYSDGRGEGSMSVIEMSQQLCASGDAKSPHIEL